VWEYLRSNQKLLQSVDGQFLHVAPEASLERAFRRQFRDRYLTADISNPRAQIQMDITEIQYPDGHFGAIYCSHVLEHIVDDRAAMRELCRVLSFTGWAMLLVPISADTTFEDPSVTDPAERLRLFGQVDHVRRYGWDYVDRLECSGFVVEHIDFIGTRSDDEIRSLGIRDNAGELFLCRKSEV